MKELSIKEKAKAYDNVREKIAVRFGSNVADEIFSEYEESEDERIRKALIEMVHDTTGDELWVDYNVHKEDALAWLEKQGEQKHVEWSEEDEKYMQSIVEHFEIEKKRDGTQFGAKVMDEHINWLKSIKDRVQPRQEWSEEDEKILRTIISDGIRGAEFDILQIDWLKSLRPQNSVTDEELAQAKKDAYNDAIDKIEYHSGEPTFDDGWSAAIWYLKKKNAQPQLQWKPNEEQIRWLYCAMDDAEKGSRMKQVLYELLEQLKKLIEE